MNLQFRLIQTKCKPFKPITYQNTLLTPIWKCGYGESSTKPILNEIKPSICSNTNNYIDLPLDRKRDANRFLKSMNIKLKKFTAFIFYDFSKIINKN